MERVNDAHHQYEPEQQATDGEQQSRGQQPELKLCGYGQRLACRPLHDDSPASIWDSNGTEKPILAIGPHTDL